MQPLGRTVCRVLKNLGIKAPYDPAIPLLSIYPEETKIEKDTCIPLFIVALFTKTRTWKHPTPVLLPGKSHGQRSLVGYRPQGYKESDTTEVPEHTQLVSSACWFQVYSKVAQLHLLKF